MRFVVRGLKYLTGVFCLIAVWVKAQGTDTYTIEQEAPADAPVVVFGSANEGNGQRDSVLLEQNNEENPLGNPIQTVESGSQNTPSTDCQLHPTEFEKTVNAPLMIQENLPKNPPLSPQESPQIINKQIQDTLYESGGRIYDIQSYPIGDIDYIEQPNLNPTITTYPAN